VRQREHPTCPGPVAKPHFTLVSPARVTAIKWPDRGGGGKKNNKI